MRKCIQIVGAETVHNATVIEDLSQLQLDDSTPESLLMTAAAEVRARMNLTDASVALKIGGKSVEDAAAVYISGPKPTICVAETTLSDPLQTVVSLAHEYAHHILLSRPDRTEADADERLTDLMPVCFGFGVLASDAALSFASWSTGTWSGWSMSRHGYLNALEIGYAMAMFAFQRDERKPHWQRRLRADAGVTMKAATKYYQSMRSRNTLPLFAARRIPDTQATLPELQGWLESDDSTYALAAAWRFSAMPRLDPIVLPLLFKATFAEDPELVPIALALLSDADTPKPEWTQRITQLIRDRRPKVALAAAQTAHAIGLELSEHIFALEHLLDQWHHDPRQVLQLIGKLGPDAAAAAPRICREAARTLKTCDFENVDHALECLRNISEDAAKELRENLHDGPTRKKLIAMV